MPAEGEAVRSSLRDALAESHVSAVAIALLLLFSFGSLCRVLALPFFRIAEFLSTAIAILGVPYLSTTLTTYDRLMLIREISPLFIAVFSFVAAWLLSRWVYRSGPLRSLGRYHTILRTRNHA
jgi:hypothetical protein